MKIVPVQVRSSAKGCQKATLFLFVENIDVIMNPSVCCINMLNAL